MRNLRMRVTLLLGMIVLSFIVCLNNGPAIFVLVQDTVISYQLGDIPAPPSYTDKYSLYGGGWLLGYESDLSIEALKDYYLTELANQNWEIKHYSGFLVECIRAKRKESYRIIEIRPVTSSVNKVHVHFFDGAGGSCSFSNLP